MYRIYHDGVAAIIVDETNHCFCYTSLSKAQQVAKGIEVTISCRPALNQREEFLLELGYKKEQFVS